VCVCVSHTPITRGGASWPVQGRGRGPRRGSGGGGGGGGRGPGAGPEAEEVVVLLRPGGRAVVGRWGRLGPWNPLPHCLWDREGGSVKCNLLKKFVQWVYFSTITFRDIVSVINLACAVNQTVLL